MRRRALLALAALPAAVWAAAPGVWPPAAWWAGALPGAMLALALAGAPLRARFTGHRSGHALNNQLIRALLADRAAWAFAGQSMTAERVAVAA